MTDKETLFNYRLLQADETLQDIDNLLAGKAREFVAAIKELIAAP
ncbi:MAG: hypothetical protein WC156_00050 [Pedobacter sp.]